MNDIISSGNFSIEIDDENNLVELRDDDTVIGDYTIKEFTSLARKDANPLDKNEKLAYDRASRHIAKIYDDFLEWIENHPKHTR